MGLEKHLTTGTDNFKASFIAVGLDFPCNCCVSRLIEWKNEHCKSCGHNPITKEKEQCR